MNEPDKLSRLYRAMTKHCALPTSEFERLQPHISEIKLARHQHFAEYGKRAQHTSFLLVGAMRDYYTIDGVEKTTYFYFEDHFVAAYISCITQTPS